MSIDLTTEPAFVITRSSVTFSFPNGKTMILPSSHELYSDICDSLLHKTWKITSKLVDRAMTIKDQTDGEFNLLHGELYWKNNIKVPHSLAVRIVDSAIKEQPKKMFTMFSLRLMENPLESARESLFTFLEHKLPLTNRGTFIAYKTVDSNYRDKHTGKIDNRPGSIVEMLRTNVDANSSVECSTGLHVGSYSYVRTFGNNSFDKLLLVEVDPMDVVAVPKHDGSKMRVCRYRVLGEIDWETELPKDFITIEEVSTLFINSKNKKIKQRHQPHIVEGTQSSAVGSLFFDDLINYLTRAQQRGVSTVSAKTIQSRFKGVSSKSIAEMLIDLCNAAPNKKYISIIDKKAATTNITVKFKTKKKIDLVEPTNAELEVEQVVNYSKDKEVVPELPSPKIRTSKKNQQPITLKNDIEDFILHRANTGFKETTVKQIYSSVRKLWNTSSEEIETLLETLVKKNTNWKLYLNSARQKTMIKVH